jgi:hypothetical protein
MGGRGSPAHENVGCSRVMSPRGSRSHALRRRRSEDITCQVCFPPCALGGSRTRSA